MTVGLGGEVGLEVGGRGGEVVAQDAVDHLDAARGPRRARVEAAAGAARSRARRPGPGSRASCSGAPRVVVDADREVERRRSGRDRRGDVISRPPASAGWSEATSTHSTAWLPGAVSSRRRGRGPLRRTGRARGRGGRDAAAS